MVVTRRLRGSGYECDPMAALRAIVAMAVPVVSAVVTSVVEYMDLAQRQVDPGVAERVGSAEVPVERVW